MTAEKLVNEGQEMDLRTVSGNYCAFISGNIVLALSCLTSADSFT